MEPKHHSKIMIVIVVLVVVVVLGLGVAAIFGKRKAAPQPAVVDTRTEYEKLIDSTSAKTSSSLSDPEVQALNKSTSASAPSVTSARERAMLIESMSATEI
jgi:predicted negative regulator of RcsB-dependent stress response